MSKIIVTHHHPDLDAIMSVWLLVRFDQAQYADAEIKFVLAGKTYEDKVVDSDPQVVHVDTGEGRFDHHQDGGYGSCASRLVWESLVAENEVSATDQALKDMIAHALDIDLFNDSEWQEAKEARFCFSLSEIIPALHRLQLYDDLSVLKMVFTQLDGVYQRLKDRQHATNAINMGKKFECIWGRGILVNTGADDVSKVAQKMGYDIVVIVNTEKKRTAIKLNPKVPHSLRVLYDKIVEIEDPRLWYYHNSGHMLFNGSDKGENLSQTKLTEEKILDLIIKCDF